MYMFKEIFVVINMAFCVKKKRGFLTRTSEMGLHLPYMVFFIDLTSHIIFI